MELQRHVWNSTEAFACIKAGKPVVMTNCPLINPLSNAWSLENLPQMIKKSFKCDVFISPTNQFMFWDETKNAYNYDFTPPTTKKMMTINEFARYNVPYFFMQQCLVAEMGKTILQEYSKFPVETVVTFRAIGGWQELTHNLLLCTKRDYITPAHFDEQENMFAQLKGTTRVRLFSPMNWSRLYPFPAGHPCDRQSQVNLPTTPGADFATEEERRRFPNYSPAEEMFVDLQAGEVLYIPQFWFHQMEVP